MADELPEQVITRGNARRSTTTAFALPTIEKLVGQGSARFVLFGAGVPIARRCSSISARRAIWPTQRRNSAIEPRVLRLAAGNSEAVERLADRGLPPECRLRPVRPITSRRNRRCAVLACGMRCFDSAISD
jgi:hypothetical protein